MLLFISIVVILLLLIFNILVLEKQSLLVTIKCSILTVLLL